MKVSLRDQPIGVVINNPYTNKYRAGPAEKWKETDIQKVITMKKDRYSYQEIATAVNRTVYGVKGCLQKVRREGR